ncbi:MAG: Cys-Gln thioester bond-forming surface protein [Clostridia bacterium]|nr:Cys-Gln thioester bond-forming surface protein [Clostridia bacterium]
MKKKIISVLIIISIIVAILLGSMISYAKYADKPLTAKLSKADSQGIGYAVFDPNSSGKYIWNILSYGNNNVLEQRNLYCVKAEYGTTWETTPEQEVTYNLQYDLHSDRDTLEQNLGTDPEGVVASLIELQGGQYEQLLWLFDNMYIPGESDKDEFLEKIGVLKDELGYYKQVGENQVPYNSILTDKDILAIQKVAIWKFTNGGTYSLTPEQTLWLNVITGQDDDGNYTYDSLKGIDADRNEQAILLYNYLITSAEANKGLYEDYSLQGNKVTVDTTKLNQDENDNYILQTRIINGKYVTGPIKISAENNKPYDIDIKVTNSSGDVAFNFVNAEGTVIEDATIKNLVGTEFYISTDKNTIDELNISISVTEQKRTKTLWLAGDETKDEEKGKTTITLTGEQPIVEVKESEPEVTNFVVKPFDLALRKYITAVKSGETTTAINTRIPNYGDLSALQTGTTAEYKHRKDPVEVKDGDIVTYTIAIYNEGSKAGYASKIIDQLPTGLFMSNTHTNGGTVTSKDSQGNPVNTYTIEWDYIKNPMNYLNQITLTIVDKENAVSLNSYTTENGLDYETIEIQCIVKQEPHTKNDIILTNVAWIEEAYDSEAQKEVSSEGTLDRDSQPQLSPNVNKDNMENYKGNSENKEVLEDSSYHYKGEQDDDDFEKLVIKAVPKNFDLALFKHIAAVSKDQTIEDGEYVTDTGSIDGTYSRAPVVTAIDLQTGKITYEQDDKVALLVEPGDYVLYTIRVYNEGEISGYASKIKDTLPVGLDFVEENVKYNGIWKLEGLDSDGRQVLTTTWYAKGNGAETDAEEGDANYQANLLKALSKENVISNENPDYIDAQVLCQVVENATSDRVLVNYAQISDDTDENGKPIDDIDSTTDQWIDKEDDQDIERVKVQCFDLSLRKFITAVEGKELKDNAGSYTREPNVDVSNLINGISSTATYIHPKQPVAVQVGNKVIYTIRVYNEGDIDGFASEVKDYLPPYLKYVENSEINKQYGWQISENRRVATTRYLADSKLKAFNGTKLDYAELKIECIVSGDVPLQQNQTNIAEISEYTYNGGTVEKDVDSTSDNIVSKNYLPSDENLPSYKDNELDKTYVPGNEDDDDFEKIYVKEFDLALRKFITKVQESDVTTRVPQVKIENREISYEHTKEPLIVHVGDVVIYTLRIFNEGELAGYASEITDDIPEYLEFLPQDSTNVEYMWKMYDENGNEAENISDAVKVKTTYLSKENGENNLINAFDGTTLDYKDIKIAFKVKDPNSNQYIITNYAQISEDTDENGNAVNDNDSDTEAWNEGEDDQDIENIRVQYFDLSLLKFVSKVIMIEDGKETITETGYNGHEDPEPVVKVELHKKKLNNVIVKFGYGITITNEGDIAGYATEITDYVPEGLKFDPTDNPEWEDEGNNVISTRQLEGTLLQPGESATVEVIFTWINSSDNLALKTNTAEISEDKNEYDVPDRDSTPDNKQDGEDDIDIAKVILAISTGAIKTYFMLTLGLLTVILVGVILIKKFVL